jgi:hypothetical protein
MTNEQDLAVLSLHLYEANIRNKPDIPTGRSKLTESTGTSGFAYAVFAGIRGQLLPFESAISR